VIAPQGFKRQNQILKASNHFAYNSCVQLLPIEKEKGNAVQDTRWLHNASQIVLTKKERRWRVCEVYPAAVEFKEELRDCLSQLVLLVLHVPPTDLDIEDIGLLPPECQVLEQNKSVLLVACTITTP
jgi:hypothetical protein